MLVVVCGGGGAGRGTRPDTEVQQHADTHRDIVINTPNTSPAATLRHCTQQLSHPTLETVETPATRPETAGSHRGLRRLTVGGQIAGYPQPRVAAR